MRCSFCAKHYDPIPKWGEPYDYSHGNVGVLLDNSDGTFQPAVMYGDAELSVVVVDVNGDGKPDLATLKKSTLPVGTHAITAQYLGDSYNDKSTSAVVNQVVQ